MNNFFFTARATDNVRLKTLYKIYNSNLIVDIKAKNVIIIQNTLIIYKIFVLEPLKYEQKCF